MNEAVFAFLDQNRQRFLDQLCQFLRFPSVSAQPDHREDMQACARWLRDHFAAIGLDAALVQGPGHPIVTARVGDPRRGRIIIYGHYDVQPPDPLDEWVSGPFEPRVQGEYLIARGSTDDKGQLFAHAMAIEALLQAGCAPDCEVLFLVEGEEECGGHHLSDYLRANAPQLAEGTLGVIVSDSDMPAPNQPAITYALRGLAALEVNVRTLSRDLHSGTFGGAVGNPLIALSQMLAACVAPDGRILIPGFYDAVRPLAPWEQDNLDKVRYDEAVLARELGTPRLHGESGFDPRARIWARPTFEVNGMWGGYTAQGSKTVIPAQATAKITMRLVPDQDPEQIATAAQKWFEQLCPPYAQCTVQQNFTAEPLIFDVNTSLLQQARTALTTGFGRAPLYTRCGGSIPVVDTFWRELGKPVLLMGLGLADDGAHSPNEHFRLDHLAAGARSSAALLAGLRP